MKALNLLFLFLFLIGQGMAADSEPQKSDLWSSDYSATLKKSKATGKPALVYFAGSNWCGFCKRLEADVLTAESFKGFAVEHFELVKLDFPRPAPVGDRTYELNVWLKEQHGVRGFPTILILDGDGALLASTGYRGNGPKAFIASLKKILAAYGS